MNWTAPILPEGWVRFLDLLYMGTILAGMWIVVLIKERRDGRKGRHID